jgi:hypothetical protein
LEPDIAAATSKAVALAKKDLGFVVLIAGCSLAKSDAELSVPSTSMWTPRTRLSTVRMDHLRHSELRETRPDPCIFRLSQCTSVAPLSGGD